MRGLHLFFRNISTRLLRVPLLLRHCNVPIHVKPQEGGRGVERPSIGEVFDLRSLPFAGDFDDCGLWVGTFDINR